MSKSDIYRLIGYHGEYNVSVKKAIRKLLKDNHPDNKGNREKFELISEVKKELETGKISYNQDHNDAIINDNTDIDYKFCYEMIKSLKTKKSNFNTILEQKKDTLNFYENEYKTLYEDSLNMENKLLMNSSYVKKIRSIKLLSIVLVIIMVIIFTISLLKNNNVLFAIFIILSVVCILVIQEYIILMHKMTECNRKRLTNYVKLNNRIRKNINKQAMVKKEIRDVKKRINSIENDLRFYKNLLK